MNLGAERVLNIQKQCLFIFIGILGLLVVPVTGEDAPNIETQVETVVIGDHPTAQLSYDNSGIPYILTLSTDNKNLILFTKVNNTWIYDIIDSNYQGSSELSFSVDKNGNPHFCFYQTENNTIISYYSRILNGIREDFVIGHVNGNPRLFLDREDRAHFLYRNCTTNDQCSLIHSWLDGSNLISETIENVWGLDDIDVAFDPSNNIHVAYGSSNGYNGLQSLKYAYKSGNDWNIEIIDIAGSGDCKCNIAGVSIDLGSDNKPHIAYRFGWWTSGPIKYAHLNEQNIWEFSIIDESYGGGSPEQKVYDGPKLVVDDKDQPLIAYSSTFTENSGYSVVNSSIVLNLKKEGLWHKTALYYKDDSARLLCSSFKENGADNFGMQFYEYYPKLGTGDNSIKYLTFENQDFYPKITSLTPSIITTGSDDFTLEVTGANFVDGVKVLWDGQERATVFMSATKINASILQADVANAGVYNVKVMNPDGKESGELHFEVTPSSSGELLPPPTLLGPGDLSSPGPTLDTLTLIFNWTIVPEADEYGLYIRNLDADTLVFDSRRDGYIITGNNFILPSGILQPDTHYRWNMNSHNISGWNDDPISGYSQKLYFTTPSGTQPQALPVITESLTLSPGPYKVGDTISATYTIRNDGSAAITFSNLTVGGRYNLDGTLPDGTLPDFTHRTTTLQLGESYEYYGEITPNYAGEYHFFCAYSPYSEDQSGWNCNIPIANSGIIREVDINVMNNGQEMVPVILIHGFTGSPETWNDLIKKLDSNGIPYHILDYQDYNTADPRDVASSLDSYIKLWRVQDNYQGKYDIVCHSMGGLVSRWYIEQIGGEDNIRQWIGIGPASEGSALAELLPEFIGGLLDNFYFKGPARQQIRTDSDTVLTLKNDVSDDDIIYHVIVGTNTQGDPNFGEGSSCNLPSSIFSNYPGTTYVRSLRLLDQYGWTYAGDGIVAVEQSKLNGATLDWFKGVDHIHLTENIDVQNRVIQYLKDPTFNSFNQNCLVLTPTKPMVGGIITFDANLHQRLVDKRYTYNWDFGDGNLYDTSYAVVEHQYSIPQNYLINVTITDNDGNSQYLTKNLDLTLKPGDIFLTRTGGLDPGTVVPGLWSHAGIYSNSCGNSNEIIEALGTGVTTRSLSKWSYPSMTYVAVYRVKGITDDEGKAVLKIAENKIGSWYDFGTISIYVASLLPLNSPYGKQLACEDYNYIFGIHPPFCGDFYCSELVWYAYKKALNIDLDTWESSYGDFIAPSEIADSPYVELVGKHLENYPSKVMDDAIGGLLKCPVDVEITDPNGCILNKNYNTIPNSSYYELDIDNNSQFEDLFIIFSPIPGEYTFQIIPEQNASSNDKYTFQVSKVNGTNMNITHFINTTATIQEIPEIPYHVIVSNALVNSDFNLNQTSGFIPMSILIFDTSTGNITSRLWSFGDGTTTENLTEVIHTYSQSGNYTITLTVSGPDGEDTSSQIIEVLPPQCTLFGNATIFGNPAPVGSLVSASAAGFNQSVVIEQEGWYGEAEMGQGMVLQGDIPTGSPITFMINGSPAWFGLPDEYGNTTWLGTSFPFFPNSVLHVNLDVPTTLTADFSASQTTGASPFDVIFTDLSEGDPFIRIWDFGDGSNETTVLNSTHHVYANPGVYTVHLTVKRGAAQSELMKTGYITVTHPPPIANFTANTTIGQLPLPIQFADNSTGEAITSRLWSFGDGGTSTEINPIHVYTTSDLYTVSLDVTNDGGSDTNTKADYIRVFDATPLADFIAEPQSGSAPLTVQFRDTSVGSPNGWQWDFGDGTTTTLQSPLHTYTTPGNYTVTLTAGSSGGTNTTVKADFIQVFQRVPVANFTANTTSGGVPLSVQFTDTSTGSPTSWSWSFGDGNTSTVKNPLYTYAAPGMYSVSLLVLNAHGSDTLEKEDFIYAALFPIADFNASVTSAFTNQRIRFYDLSSGSPTTWLWDFGNGQTSTLQNPSLRYSDPGNYTVSLTAANEAGNDTAIKPEYIAVTPRPPTVDFDAFPKDGSFPLTVTFYDYSYGGYSENLTYEWDFGDGTPNSTSDAYEVVHTYMISGVYSVTLTVSSDGISSTLTKENYIGKSSPPPPVAMFTATPRAGDAPLLVSFIDQSSGSPPLSFFWDFGDGANSTEQNPVHQYLIPGSYNVTLTATNAGGSSTESKESYVVVESVAPLKADFTSNVTTGTVPVTVQFLDASIGNPSAWSWVFEKDSYYPVRETATKQAIPYFGNEISAEKNPVVTYLYPGNYSVSLTVSRTGETDTITKEDYIQINPPAPVVDFNAYPLVGEAPLNVEFWEMVPYSWYYDEFLWDFGDGTNGTGTWLYHTYNTPGLYNVTLIVNSAYGSNSTTKTHFINVTLSPPVPEFEGTPAAGDAPLDVVFTDTSIGMITTRLWDFGDGTTEWVNATPTVSHSYPFPGNYTVSLTVGNDAGEESLSRTAYIQVNPTGTPPRARFTVSPMMGYKPLTVRFTDRSSGTPLKWHWDFGDGNTSSERNPTHTYSTAGRYTPALTVFNSGGSTTHSSFIWVRSQFVFPTITPFPTITAPPTTTTRPTIPPQPGQPLISFFKMNTSFGKAPLTVQFTDLSFNTPTSWQWDFGDGHTSTVKNPVNTFTNTGTYSVSLTVNNSIGESRTSRTVYVR